MKNNLLERIPAELPESFVWGFAGLGREQVKNGSVVLEFERKRSSAVLCADDHILLPLECVHRVARIESDLDTIGLAVHLNL